MKKKIKYDGSARKQKVAGIDPSVIRKGAWELHREKIKRQKDLSPKHLSDISPKTQLSIAQDRVAGMPIKSLQEKYELSKEAVLKAIKASYVNGSVGKRVLKGMILENAIAFGQRSKDKMDELTAMQSVIAAGIMTQRFIELEKHTMSEDAEVDFEEILSINKGLQGLQDYIPEGEIIDI